MSTTTDRAVRWQQVRSRVLPVALFGVAAIGVFWAIKPSGWPGDYPLTEYPPIAEQVAQLAPAMRTACDGLPSPDERGRPWGLPLADPDWIVTAAVICPWTGQRDIPGLGLVALAEPSRVTAADLPAVIAALTEDEDRSIPFFGSQDCPAIGHSTPYTALTLESGEKHLVRAPEELCGYSPAEPTLRAAHRNGEIGRITG